MIPGRFTTVISINSNFEMISNWPVFDKRILAMIWCRSHILTDDYWWPLQTLLNILSLKNTPEFTHFISQAICNRSMEGDLSNFTQHLPVYWDRDSYDLYYPSISSMSHHTIKLTNKVNTSPSSSRTHILWHEYSHQSRSLPIIIGKIDALPAQDGFTRDPIYHQR